MSEEFLKWYNYYETHLKFLYKKMLRTLKIENRFITKNHSYTAFCYLIYNKSSKRIPLY